MSQVHLVQEVLVLNNIFYVSYEALKPAIVFYSTRSLKIRENYVFKFKIHTRAKPRDFLTLMNKHSQGILFKESDIRIIIRWSKGSLELIQYL